MVTHDAEVASKAEVVRKIDKGKLVAAQSARDTGIGTGRGSAEPALGAAGGR